MTICWQTIPSFWNDLQVKYLVTTYLVGKRTGSRPERTLQRDIPWSCSRHNVSRVYLHERRFMVRVMRHLLRFNVKLTLHIRVSLRIIWRAIAFRFIVSQNAASCVIAALHIRTRVHLALLTQTASLGIAHASCIATALVASTGQLSTDGVIAARIA